MIYSSTRSNNEPRTASYVIMNGIAPDGGLYIPNEIPKLEKADVLALSEMSYHERAAKILSMFLTDYTYEELLTAATDSYSEERFKGGAAPISKLGESGKYMLELWHGPTSAFKDMALQIMPRLLSMAIEKSGTDKEALILVATSGDTGKAALEGYADVDRVRISVFYPSDGVSNIQKMQMVTQKGKNVCVSGVKGNFDHCQTAVKQVFSNEEIRNKIAEENLFFSSANSINWGRLAPQIVYYVSSYCDLLKEKEITYGEEVNVCVPTGNFGNILAAYIAKLMGIPFAKLICASNSNKILYDFFETGVYDRRREFYTTISPSMDILISSNLERLLSMVAGNENCEKWMKELFENGIFTVPDEVRKTLSKDFKGFFADEAQTQNTIKRYFDEFGYLIDPHTAVALHATDTYMSETGDTKKTIVVSTASPYKFSGAVLEALGYEIPADDFEALERLQSISGTNIPENLYSLKSAEKRFNAVIEKEEIPDKVLEFSKNKDCGLN
ncbi:MAG: threonine synthase [Ruminococcaceae bacterium]|nr:threonine synthase [Oscillospiraceae bacterium]